MYFSKATCCFLFFSLFTSFSLAATQTRTVGWADGNGEAAVLYTPSYSDNAMIFVSTISHSLSGNQRIYFASFYLDDYNICNHETDSAEDTTMIFSGQAVKMLRWCQKSPNGNYYYSYTPETYRGDNYVVNLFKKATTPIKIQIHGETVYFPVIGFTKAWNSAGGDAI